MSSGIVEETAEEKEEKALETNIDKCYYDLVVRHLTKNYTPRYNYKHYCPYLTDANQFRGPGAIHLVCHYCASVLCERCSLFHTDDAKVHWCCYYCADKHI